MAAFSVTTTVDAPFDGFETEACPDNTGLSLRGAIALAAATSGADRIVFDPSLAGATTELCGGQSGGPLEIDDAGRFGVTAMLEAHARIEGASITCGKVKTPGGGARVEGLANQRANHWANHRENQLANQRIDAGKFISN
ncbi:MAG: hypothetical protein AAGF79_16595 [Pseudomonadota bacterium]